METNNFSGTEASTFPFLSQAASLWPGPWLAPCALRLHLPGCTSSVPTLLLSAAPRRGGCLIPSLCLVSLKMKGSDIAAGAYYEHHLLGKEGQEHLVKQERERTTFCPSNGQGLCPVWPLVITREFSCLFLLLSRSVRVSYTPEEWGRERFGSEKKLHIHEP